MSPTCSGEARGRRTQRRRTRYGCRNCKLRKIKCDERRPQCERCKSYGVLCNFGLGVRDLQPVADGSVWLKLRAPVSNALWTSDSSTTYQLDTKCQDFINRYLGRSLVPPEDPAKIEVNRKLLALAFTHPYLMHASLAIALAYDRYFNSSSNGVRTVEECYHWSRSTALLNKRLSEPITANDKDPIWGTAAAMALLSFAYPDVCDAPERSWPMKPSEPTDLAWLSMSKGKSSLWAIVNPLRPDSIFHVLAPTYAEMDSPMPGEGVDGIPTALAIVCGLQDSSTADGNAYFHPAHAVSRILNLPDSQVTLGKTELFIRSIHGAFHSLLLGKDPVALLLLYLWYRKAGCSIWWMGLRAKVECPAICLYLQRYHEENHDVQAFLPGGFLANV